MDEQELALRAKRADETQRLARIDFVHLVREAHSSGMPQRKIAAIVGRSQPEIHRLVHFHGDSPAGLALRKARAKVDRILAANGLSNPRVFGSTAIGEDNPDSDVDILVTASQQLGLMALARVEKQLSDVIGRKVDLVLDHAIRSDLADEILRTAVPL